MGSAPQAALAASLVAVGVRPQAPRRGRRWLSRSRSAASRQRRPAGARSAGAPSWSRTVRAAGRSRARSPGAPAALRSRRGPRAVDSAGAVGSTRLAPAYRPAHASMAQRLHRAHALTASTRGLREGEGTGCGEHFDHACVPSQDRRAGRVRHSRRVRLAKLRQRATGSNRAGQPGLPSTRDSGQCKQLRPPVRV